MYVFKYRWPIYKDCGTYQECNNACICLFHLPYSWLNQPPLIHQNSFKCTPHKPRSTPTPTHTYLYIYPKRSGWSKQSCACLLLVRFLKIWFWLLCWYEIDIWTTSLVHLYLIIWGYRPRILSCNLTWPIWLRNNSILISNRLIILLTC